MNRTVLDRAWLGGNDIEVEGTWKWVDCSPWNLTFWASGEPNNYRGVPENCLTHKFDYGWNDVPCSLEYGFLCSKSICPG